MGDEEVTEEDNIKERRSLVVKYFQKEELVEKSFNLQWKKFGG